MNTALASEVSLACVRCDKPLRPVKGCPDGSAESHAWDDAMVHVMHAGYGSKHDCGTFVVGLCDPCIDALLSQKKIVDVTEGP